jgi:cobalt-zinc-cadmium resistance protein CzcA
MKLYQIKYLFISIFIGINGIKAQNIFDLSSAIQTAKTNNFGLKNTLLEVQSSKKLENSAFDIPKTDFNTQYGNINDFQIDYSFNVSQGFSLPNVYKRRQKFQQTQSNFIEKRAKYEEIVLVKDVKIAYFNLLFEYEKRNLLQKQDSIYTNLLKKIDIKMFIKIYKKT